MKKKIIALVLALVMSIAALVSCGGFYLVNQDLSQYATFDVAAFKDALQKIEITDGDFTTNEATRDEKVIESIYSEITGAIVKNARDSEKLEAGVIGERDVLYYCYYITYTNDDGVTSVFNYSDMKESAITASSTSSNHVIQLAVVDKDDEFLTKLQAAVTGVDVTDKIYSMDATKGTQVTANDTIVVSFNREYTLEIPKVDEDGNPVTDNDGNPVTETETYKETALYHTIKLDTTATDDALMQLLLADGTTLKVGNNVSVKVGEGESAKDSTTFDVKQGEVTYTYSNFKVEWIVESEGAAIAEIKHTPYDKETKLEPSDLHISDTKIDLKDKELTYHIFPVYYLAVPEISAETILEEIFGSKLTVDSLEALGDEEYKLGEKTVKDLIAELADLYSETYDEKSTDETIKNLIALKKAFDDAEKAYDDEDDATKLDALEEALDAAELAYDNALDAAIKDKILQITATTKADADPMTKLIVDEYTEDTYHSLKEAYDKEITEAVGVEVYKLIDKYVTVTAYPDELVDEFYHHLYEEYEYKFYKEKYDSNNSNYKYYGGDFNKYLLAATGAEKDHKGDITAAITAEAKEFIDPLIKVYVVAKALETEAVAALPGYIQLDIDQGGYNAFYEDDDEKSEDENKKLKEEAEKEAEDAAAEALENASKFIITDEVFNEYKKELGAKTYEAWEKEYGERNIRASIQANRLFYYLLCTNIVVAEDGDHTEVLYKQIGDGSRVLDFRTVSYTIKVETDDDSDDSDDSDE